MVVLPGHIEMVEKTMGDGVARFFDAGADFPSVGMARHRVGHLKRYLLLGAGALRDSREITLCKRFRCDATKAKQDQKLGEIMLHCTVDLV